MSNTTEVSVVVPADLSCTGASRRKLAQVDVGIADLVRRLNHPVHGEEPITRASCDGHGTAYPSIHLEDGRVLVVLPANVAADVISGK